MIVKSSEKFKNFLINSVASKNIIPGRLRVKLYNLMGMRIETSTFYSECYFSGSKLSVGENSWINFRCSFENHMEKIVIGNNCAVAMEVLFCTSSHTIGDEGRRGGKTIYAPIVVEDGCWIGAKSIILQGVTIKKGCIIAAGSVVTKDCESNSLYAGVPAKRIKKLSNNESIKNI